MNTERNVLDTSTFQVGEGRTIVNAIFHNTKQGIQVLLTGGTTPHIGAVVMALPRHSLKKDNSLSSDCFILPVPGHKDHIPAQLIAQSLAEAFDIPCVVTAGIHSDDISQQEIEDILKNTQILLQKMIETKLNPNS